MKLPIDMTTSPDKVSLLILGAQDKQSKLTNMLELSHKGDFNLFERDYYKGFIFSNMLQAMQIVLEIGIAEDLKIMRNLKIRELGRHLSTTFIFDPQR